MARALRIQYPGAFYHITCRGNERRAIFNNPLDTKVFLEKLSDSLGIFNVTLLAYVCMPNHFHLLLKTSKANLAEFMRHFNICYTSAFNRNHHRVGHLYQGRYKSFLIDADNYLLEVSRYIHLNPIRTRELAIKSLAEQREALQRYTSSSFLGYISPSKREKQVDYGFILEQMGGDDYHGREKYGKFIISGITGEIESPLKLGKGHGIVGNSAFIKKIKIQCLKDKNSRREQPAVRELSKVFEPYQLIQWFIDLTGKSMEEIVTKGRNSLERSMLMEFLYEFCGISQLEIGRRVGGIDYSAVSQSRKRLRQKLVKDTQLQKKFEKLKLDLLDLSSLKI
jgi:REP element-mobilizing transposase RayT